MPQEDFVHEERLSHLHICFEYCSQITSLPSTYASIEKIVKAYNQTLESEDNSEEEAIKILQAIYFSCSTRLLIKCRNISESLKIKSQSLKDENYLKTKGEELQKITTELYSYRPDSLKNEDWNDFHIKWQKNIKDILSLHETASVEFENQSNKENNYRALKIAEDSLSVAKINSITSQKKLIVSIIAIVFSAIALSVATYTKYDLSDLQSHIIKPEAQTNDQVITPP
jgi:hypothetical protein